MITKIKAHTPYKLSKNNIPKSIYIPKSYSLRPSTIPGAGLGIYAEQTLPAGQQIAVYKGDYLKPAEFQRLVDSGKDFIYLWQINDYPDNPDREVGTSYDPERPIGYIDGGRTKTANFIRYINCARNRREENVIPKQIGPEIYYFVKRPIKSGEELLVWYGPSYGKLLTGKSKLS